MATLKTFYGQGFQENAISKNANVETIDKDNLKRSLKTATRNTTKGEDQKIKHASKLLELLDVDKVRKVSLYCVHRSRSVSQRRCWRSRSVS